MDKVKVVFKGDTKTQLYEADDPTVSVKDDCYWIYQRKDPDAPTVLVATMPVVNVSFIAVED